MSADISMSSDDDAPIRARSGPSTANGNGHVGTNGTNGKGHYDESSPLSDDDDLPLVRILLSPNNISHLMHRHLLF